MKTYDELKQQVQDLEMQLIAAKKEGNIPEETLEIKLKNKDKQIQELQSNVFKLERRLRLITNNTKDIVYRYSLIDNKFHYITHSVFNVLGYTVEELSSDLKSILEKILDENLPIFENKLSKLLNYQNYDNFTIKALNKSGELVWIDVNWHLIYDKDRKPNAIEGVIRDITSIELRKLELRKKTLEYISLNGEKDHVNQQLKDSLIEIKKEETRFRSLFQNMDHGVVIFELSADSDDFIFKDLNVAAEKLEQIKKEDIIGRIIGNKLPVLKENRLLKTFKSVWVTEKSDTISLTNRNEEGDIESWIDCFVYKLQSGELVVIYKDISKRKKVEEDLVKSKERYTVATEETKVSVWERNPLTGKGHIDSVLFKMLGYPTPNVSDNFSIWKNYIHPEDLNNLLKKNEQLRKGKIDSFELEFKANHKNGDLKWFLDKGVALKDYDGKIYKLTGTISDITNQKQVEEQLIQAKEKAEESDKLKSSFLANMSHEIRTPMNGILGFADLLKSEDLNKEEHDSFIDIIIESGNKLLDIIRDILDISKIEAGQIKLNQEKCSINHIIDNLQTQYKFNLGTNSDIKIDIYKDLSDNDSTIITDSLRLEQILSNLLSNAVKFIEKGYVEFGYMLVNKNNQTNLQFFVKDTGIGIPDNKRHIIFNAFRQLDDSHTRQYGGTGLGLTIVRGLVSLLNGDIWFESTEGEGSTFYFTIPYINTTLDFIPEKINYDNNNFNWADKTVLVIDDDETSFKYLEYILNKTKINIIRGSSGKDAIEACLANDIDIVLMDIQLPELNGYEASQEIRKFKPNMPIIAQTANALPEDKNKSINAGCNDYIAKPIKRNILLNKMDKLLIIN